MLVVVVDDTVVGAAAAAILDRLGHEDCIYLDLKLSVVEGGIEHIVGIVDVAAVADTVVAAVVVEVATKTMGLARLTLRPLRD